MVQEITACAFIHQNGKLFAPRRAKTKKLFPDKFELPGGHIEFGEDIVRGLEREIDEEFHLKITVGDPFYAFTYLHSNRTIHAVEIVYFARFLTERPEIRLNPEDHSEYRFVTQEEAMELWLPDDTERPAIVRGFDLLNKTV